MNKFLSRALTPLLIYILLFLFAFPRYVRASASSPFARAENTSTLSSLPNTGDYACILSEGVFLYSSPDERKGLFLLPASYYVRLIEYRFDYCKVEYQRNEGDAKRIVGYAKTEELTFVDYQPARPYLYSVFDVTYTIGDSGLGDSSFLTEITVSCVYYGDYRIGSELYCYVLRGEEFGYIPKPNGFSIAKNTEYEEYLAAQTPPTAETPPSTTEDAPSSVQIAILIAICLLVPVLAALILKPPRRLSYEMDE